MEPVLTCCPAERGIILRMVVDRFSRGCVVTEVEKFHIRDLDLNLLHRERERALSLIRRVVPFASVMEVGSTAIEGVVGKQDLDFVVRVTSNCFGETRSILDQTFPRNDRQLSNEEYQGYVVPSEIDVAIQLIAAQGKYDNFEKFLQALSADPSLKHAYNELKISWHGRPMEEYRLAKQNFIDSVLSNRKEPAT
jgi:GrpB-like predicted nucleotidyltransferase (UPF0157 family)